MACLTSKELNQLKVIYTLNTVCHSVLLDVYHHVKPFPFYKNIKDHLIQDLGWSNKKFKNTFDKTQRNKIESSVNSGEEYDISLLVKILRVLSEHYEPEPTSQNRWNDEHELEGKCKILKDTRNEVFHSIVGISDNEMRIKIDTIEKLLKAILESLKGRFPSESSNINDRKADIQNRISYVLLHPLGDSEIRACILQRDLKILQDEIPAYKIRCKEWGKMQILDFLLGSRTFYDVNLLFTDVIVEKSSRHTQHKHIECKDILKMDAAISTVLIESEAGGGKTTVFRKGINNWGEGGLDMNTDDYDFIFPMVFRNPRIDSVKELIGSLIQSTRNKIGIDSIMNCITDPSLKLNVLFFCDGYDEKNEKSRQLFSEICNLNENYPNIRVIVTSRPESIEDFFYSNSQNYSIEHLKLKGIEEHNRGNFLKTYHDQLIKAKESSQSTEDLLYFYANISARHKELYRLPINLVILAYLWGIKIIILESYGEDSQEIDLSKYQNIIQLLGGIIALRDVSLVEVYGQYIIDLLIETGVRNNSQWYDIYSDFNVNPSAAEKFGKLIAPHLNYDNFTIKAADVEILCTLFKHIEVDNVTLDISSSDKPPHLPALMNLLSEKNCIVNTNSDFFSMFTS